MQDIITKKEDKVCEKGGKNTKRKFCWSANKTCLCTKHGWHECGSEQADTQPCCKLETQQNTRTQWWCSEKKRFVLTFSSFSFLKHDLFYMYFSLFLVCHTHMMWHKDARTTNAWMVDEQACEYMWNKSKWPQHTKYRKLDCTKTNEMCALFASILCTYTTTYETNETDRIGVTHRCQG